MLNATMRRWGRAIGDLLYPRPCAVCGAAAGEAFAHLCWDCSAEIDFLQHPMCSRCGEPVAGRVDGAFECHLCCAQPRHFHKARSAARYDGATREMVRLFKYEQGLWLRNDLVSLLAVCVDTHYDEFGLDLVVPVPLHPVKRRTRGYNQAEVLAAGLAQRMGLPCFRRALRRVRSTSTQTRLTARQRADNVRGAFSANMPARFRQKQVLLVDDVMTTGATVSECSRCLLAAGAAGVWVVTVARG